MQKKLVALVAFLITALVLVGCSVEFSGPSNVLTGKKITADAADIDMPLSSVQKGESERYQVEIPQGFSADLLVIDVRGVNFSSGVSLNVRTSSGNQIAYSASHIFGKDRASVEAASISSDFSSQAIDVGGPAECAGICVILPKETYLNGALIVDVINPSNQAAFVHAFGAKYQDSGEPLNNKVSGAIGLEPESSGYGAFETVNDVDYWRHIEYLGPTAIIVNGPAEVRIEMESNDIEPFAEIYNPNTGQYYPLPLVRDMGNSRVYWTDPGSDGYLVNTGEYLVLTALNGLASDIYSSGYEVSFHPPLP